MANKLKDLTVTKVDFVDAGANPEADVVLFKSKPADPAAQAATEEGHDKPDGAFKRFVAGLFKSVGVTDTQADVIMAEIAKSSGEAETFGEKMIQQQLRRAADEIWDYCYALQESLCSILRDTDVPAENKPALMTQSCTEFVAAVTAAIPKWSTGVPSKVEKSADAPLTEERLLIAKEAKDRLDEMIQKAAPATAPQATAQAAPSDDPASIKKSDTKKGENTEMNIDKSKLTPEELATLDAIEKKAGIPETTPPAPAAPAAAPATDPVEKAAPTAETPAEDDIYKGMHPAVAEELRNLRKFREEQEDRDMLAVAKKYELLGKKPEELAPVLKSLKAAGGSAYADMIGVLDASLATMQASPAFNEIGKRGGLGGAEGSDADVAWSQIEKKAEEIMKSAPTMSRAQAIDKACQDNPDLVHQYENNR